MDEVCATTGYQVPASVTPAMPHSVALSASAAPRGSMVLGAPPAHPNRRH